MLPKHAGLTPFVQVILFSKLPSANPVRENPVRSANFCYLALSAHRIRLLPGSSVGIRTWTCRICVFLLWASWTVIQMYGSGSFCNQAKMSLLCHYLRKKMWMYLQKVVFIDVLKVKDENSRRRSRIRIHWSEARIRNLPKCQGSGSIGQRPGSESLQKCHDRIHNSAGWIHGHICKHTIYRKYFCGLYSTGIGIVGVHTVRNTVTDHHQKRFFKFVYELWRKNQKYHWWTARGLVLIVSSVSVYCGMVCPVLLCQLLQHLPPQEPEVPQREALG